MAQNHYILGKKATICVIPKFGIKMLPKRVYSMPAKVEKNRAFSERMKGQDGQIIKISEVEKEDLINKKGYSLVEWGSVKPKEADSSASKDTQGKGKEPTKPETGGNEGGKTLLEFIKEATVEELDRFAEDTHDKVIGVELFEQYGKAKNKKAKVELLVNFIDPVYLNAELPLVIEEEEDEDDE